MNVRIFGCGRFRFLSSEALDRPLSVREEKFLQRHRSVCAPCRVAEDNQAMALNMLRSTALNGEPAEGFDRRVLRRVRVQTLRESASYWSPAAIGATVATALVLGILQFVAKPTQLEERVSPTGEARRVIASPTIPDLRPESPQQ